MRKHRWINKKRAVIFSLMVAASTLSACCVPIPWSVWGYHEVRGINSFPSNWNITSIQTQQHQNEELYIDGAFVHIFVRAHNHTNRRGSSPFRLFVGVVTNNTEHKSVIYHAVTIVDTNGNRFVFQPIEYNTPGHVGEETGSARFPITVNLNSPFARSTTQANNYIQTSLWSDDTIPLNPENGRMISVSADIEIIGSHSRVRRTIVYDFLPSKRSGKWQCVTA